MAQEYLWRGKYRILSEVDPATYYPNGTDVEPASGYPLLNDCFRLEFPISPSSYFYGGFDSPTVLPTRKYFEQEDITDDPVWAFSLVANIGNLLCVGVEFDNPGFLILSGDFSPDMVLNLDSGKLTGRTGEMDQYVSGLNIPADYVIDEQNYATIGSASYFRNGVGLDIPIKLTARVFSKSDPSLFIDGSFEYKLRNNWSSDRDYLILNIKNQFFINGATATNLDYLEDKKAKGFFPGPP